MLQVPMAPRSPDLTPADFWLWGYLKSSIRSIKSVGTERCGPQRSILTSGHVALCRCWICHSSGMSSTLWWWSCGTYSGVIKFESFLFIIYAFAYITG
ncbi:hypothetical protein TNCV_1966051 [Trichonephila clavipes]|nr:hypothetical protein TNCV_1966051 [Trichonephila clavipes]